MRAVVVILGMLASSGCEVLFPIDGDTDDGDGDDAPPAPDAGLGYCASVAGPTVALCADFDTPATGLGASGLMVVQSAQAVLAEVESPEAPSAPRVLTTVVPGSATTPSWAYGVTDLVPPVVASFVVRANGDRINVGCEPVVIEVAVGTLELQVQSTTGGFRILVQRPSSTDTLSVAGGAGTGWHEVAFEVDAPLGNIRLVVDQGVESRLTSDADLMAAMAQPSQVWFGTSLAGPHDPCGVELDDLVIERVEP